MDKTYLSLEEAQKLVPTIKKDVSRAAQAMLQEASNKASILMTNLKMIMSGEISASDAPVESIDNQVKEIDV